MRGENALYISEVWNRRRAAFETGPGVSRFSRTARAVTGASVIAGCVVIVTRDFHAPRVFAGMG
jgi:hypothetical protein